MTTNQTPDNTIDLYPDEEVAVTPVLHRAETQQLVPIVSCFSMAIDSEAGDDNIGVRLVKFYNPEFCKRFIALPQFTDEDGLHANYTIMAHPYNFEQTLEENIRALVSSPEDWRIHQKDEPNKLSVEFITNSILDNLPANFEEELKVLRDIIANGTTDSFEEHNAKILDFYNRNKFLPEPPTDVVE